MYMNGRRGGVFAPRRRRHVFRWIFLALFLVIVGTGIYTVLDNGRVIVKTQRVLVWDLPEALEGYTILHISDLNGARLGPGHKQLSNALSSVKYNIAMLTGDMVGPTGDPYPFYELLAALNPTRPVYFIAGDSDPAPVGNTSAHAVMAEWVLGAQSRGAIYVDSPKEITVGNATLWLTHADQLALDLDSAASAYSASASPVSNYNASVIEETQRLRSAMKDEDLHVVLTHKPLTTEAAQRMLGMTDAEGQSFIRTVDLILAGDTVGGGWRLPGIGPVWSNGWFPKATSLVGYGYAGSILQYISGGLGTNAASPLPGFRLFNTPEVTLITFTSKLDDDTLP